MSKSKRKRIQLRWLVMGYSYGFKNIKRKPFSSLKAYGVEPWLQFKLLRHGASYADPSCKEHQKCLFFAEDASESEPIHTSCSLLLIFTRFQGRTASSKHPSLKLQCSTGEDQERTRKVIKPAGRGLRTNQFAQSCPPTAAQISSPGGPFLEGCLE